MFGTASPSLSEQGDFIVFSTPVTGHGDIYVADVQTGAARRLTSSDDCDLSPYFLAGSKQIVFQRERDPYRYIWALDLKTGKERQLTAGSVQDDILSVSPSDKRVLIRRLQVLFARGGTAQLYLLDVEDCTCKPLGEYLVAEFADGGPTILASNAIETVRLTREGIVDQHVADKGVVDVCDARHAALIVDYGQRPVGPDYPTFAIDLLTNETTLIGQQSRSRMFANGKVLSFVTFMCTPRNWERGAQEPREIDGLPAGYVVAPNLTVDDKKAVLFVMPANQPDRLYDIYLFDSNTEKFTRIDVVLPSVADGH